MYERWTDFFFCSCCFNKLDPFIFLPFSMWMFLMSWDTLISCHKTQIEEISIIVVWMVSMLSTSNQLILYLTGQCPLGWRRVKGQCLRTYYDSVTWPEARSKCEGYGGSLATMTQLSQNMAGTIFGSIGSYWVGISGELNFI